MIGALTRSMCCSISDIPIGFDMSGCQDSIQDLTPPPVPAHQVTCSEVPPQIGGPNRIMVGAGLVPALLANPHFVVEPCSDGKTSRRKSPVASHASCHTGQ